MYLVTIHEKNGSERTQRIWIENAHPKPAQKGFITNSVAPQFLVDIDYSDTAEAAYFNSLRDYGKAVERMHIIRENLPNANEINKASEEETVRDVPANLKIQYLELSSEALLKLGIESNDRLVRYYTESNNPSIVSASGVLRTWGVTEQRFNRSEVTVNIPQFVPAIVTDGRGRERMTTLDDSDIISPEKVLGEIARKIGDINNFIPILFRDNNSSDSVGARDLIFWYKPTPEFLALLPDSARAIAQMMASGSTNAAASVTDVHGAIQQAIAFPNPSKGQFSVKLTMGGARTLTFTLRNLLGQQAAPPVQARMVGTGEQSLDFSTVPEGVYLLDISSDQGERYIERVVIAH